jgi:pilus assembly protein CpaC
MDLRSRPIVRASALAVLLLSLSATVTQAAVEPKPIIVEAGSSHHLRLGSTVQRVSVGASDVADVAAFPPDQILVTGKRVGQTTVTVWFRNDDVNIYTIRVIYPASAMNDALNRAIPDGKDLRVMPAGSALVIQGDVASASDVEAAEAIVRGLGAGFEGLSIVNRLRVVGDHQVQLEVSFAEVSRTALKQIGVNFWHKNKDGDFTGGLLQPGTGPTGIITQLNQSGGTDTLGNANGLPIIQPPAAGAFSAIFSSAASSGFPFAAALSVLSQRGYARTLSEPTLVALSGQPATFLAGGEFPIPMPQALGTVGVDFKKFGIQLQFVPTVIGSQIQLKLAATVSDIDFSLGVSVASVTVPGVTSRHSETTVRLRDGESFAIAGLLSDRVRSSVDKVPGLGDLPILGTLFRSTRYRREETELLVVVTAHLVSPTGEKPMLPGEDTLADPSDIELFFLGSIESKEGVDEKLRPRKRARPSGPVGFAR